jgi:hypothetical protein
MRKLKSMILNKRIYDTNTAKLIEKVNVKGSHFYSLYEKQTGELFVASIEVDFLHDIFTDDDMLKKLVYFDGNKVSKKALDFHEIKE